MYNVMSIDFDGVNIPEDAYGLDGDGNLVIAISKNGFLEGIPCLIFTLIRGKLFPSTGCVKLIKRIKCNTISEIKDNLKSDYQKQVFKLMLEYHLITRGTSRFNCLNTYMDKTHTLCFIRIFMEEVYKRVGLYFGEESVNLKRTDMYYEYYFKVQYGLAH